jgi:asparagine synthase (glutamine-hydrolysing)
MNRELAPEQLETRDKHHYNSVLNQSLYASLMKGSLPSLLHYEDRNSMAFSIEARVPYLDYRLVELAYKIPSHLKIDQGTTKVVLRRATEGLIPEVVRHRKDKLGFPTPGDIWFRGLLADKAEEIFRDKRFQTRGYINPQEALDLLEQHRNGQTNAHKTLWRMMCLELWAQIFLDSQVLPERPAI